MCGLERSPDNSLMVACGDWVVVAAVHNAVAANDAAAVDDAVVTDDATAADGVVVAVGATTAVVFWVLRCWMRACTSMQSHLVSMVETLRGKKLSWWY